MPYPTPRPAGSRRNRTLLACLAMAGLIGGCASTVGEQQRDTSGRYDGV